MFCAKQADQASESHGFLLLLRPVNMWELWRVMVRLFVWVASLETFATVSNFGLHRGIENVLQTFLKFVNNLVVC